MALTVLNFESGYLHCNTEVSIILPDKPRDVDPKSFYARDRKYKVLWLLHGTHGDHTDWLYHTSVYLYATERNLIVVMPSALNSDYSNWDGFGMGFSMFDLLPNELMPLIYAWLPASEKREDNFIAGLSMGGGGAMQYVVNYPDKFAGAAILSAPPMDPRASGPFSRDPAMARRRENVLANAGGQEAFIKSYQNVWDKLPDLVKKGVLPKLYIAAGTNDFLYQGYLAFKKYAGQIGLQAEFEEIEGYGHEWRFWDRTIERALDLWGIPKKSAGPSF